MCRMISCLVGRSGAVYAFDGIHSHSRIALMANIDEDKCLKYEFHLKKRKLFQDFNMDNAPFEAKQSHDNAAMEFFNECAGTPRKLIAYVKRGNWRAETATLIWELLTLNASNEYYRKIDRYLKNYNKTRGRILSKDYYPDDYYKNDQKRSEEIEKCYTKYCNLCMNVWAKLFAKKENREGVWKNVHP